MKILTVLLMMLAPFAMAQQSALSFKSIEVSPGIYMLERENGVYSNVELLVGDEYIVLIDNGMPPDISELLDAAADLAGRPVDFVINTHSHGDHVGGNEKLANLGAIIVAHDNVRKHMLPKSDPGALPIITFSDEVTFHVNGHEAFVFHIENAHTDGDAAILFRHANVIAAGDLMFHKLFPFIDLDGGGSVAGYIAGQRKILAMADDETVIIPGHGPLASKSDLSADLAVLVDSQARVKALADKGLSEEEIISANPLAVYHDVYSWQFITTERMTRTLIRSMTTD